MLEASVYRGRVDEVDDAQLPDEAEPLEKGAVEDENFKRANDDRSPDCVVDLFRCSGAVVSRRATREFFEIGLEERLGPPLNGVGEGRELLRE